MHSASIKCRRAINETRVDAAKANDFQVANFKIDVYYR